MFREFLAHEKNNYGGISVKYSAVREMIQYLEREKLIEYVEVNGDEVKE
jgi:Mn-dependent DtxR family transcriptional regulator